MQLQRIYLLVVTGMFFTLTAFAQRSAFNTGWEFAGLEFATKEKVDSFRRLGSNWNDQFLIEQTNESNADPSDNDRLLNEQLKVLDGRSWQAVTLPHTAFPEPLVIIKPREGVAWYKKSFRIGKKDRGKSISLYFEAAMQVADVWINGRYITRHTGGYLPFIIDISQLVSYDKENNIYLRLNNKANPVVPPGKPVEKLDFIYYSGLYRGVWLDIKDPLHITDAIAAGKVAGGGVFVTYPELSKSKAVINVQTHIVNEHSSKRSFQVEQVLVNKAGKQVARTITGNNSLDAGTEAHYRQSLMVVNPALWHPDHPDLYQLKSIIKSNGQIIDEKITRIGIRSFEITAEKGLLINGEPFRITGTNRHQNHPYIGNALTPNASYRDAWLIKNAGMNCVRTGHYPPDPAFIQAADELGILIVDCIPGWQFFNRAQAFEDHVMNDIRQMIRRDRNHPSVLLWETSLNETYPSAEFRCRQAEVARSEWIGKGNFFTSGDSYFKKACWDVPYDDWNGDPGTRNNTTYPDNAFLIREYGDYEFGGGSSTTRQVRGNGQDALLQQAWNLQWEHNKNQKNYPRAIGDLTWAFYDGLAGCVVGIEGWGVADIFRIPKFSYSFFQSQRSLSPSGNKHIITGPVVNIAHYWQQSNKWNNVVVYSNCDEVALYLNGKLLARQKSDQGPETDYGTDFEKGGKPFDGGNANYLPHPPFTFKNISFVPGTLKAVGYIGRRESASSQVTTAGKPAKMQLEIAENGKPVQRGVDDNIFVHVRITDAAGNLVTGAVNTVTLKLQGVALLESPQTVKAEAGIATFIVRTLQASSLKITATSAGIPSISKVIF